MKSLAWNIYPKVLLSRDLSHTAILLFHILSNLSSGDGSVIISKRAISDMINVSIETVTVHLKALRYKKLIDWQRHKHVNRYFVLI